jgi:PAS domain S-box-containing protein
MKEHPLGRLLIVDDEIELTTALVDTLRNEGYESIGATSGKDALELMESRDFDLLLTDLMMPGMDGVELLRSALKIDPHLVVILMTGYGTVENAVEAMKGGAFYYILKPFKLQALLPILCHGMEVRRLRTDNVQLRETLAIYELGQTIAHTLDWDTLLNKAADAGLQQLEADEVSIMLPTLEGNELYVAAVRGDKRERVFGARIPMGLGIAGWVAHHQTALTLEGKVSDPRFAPVYPRPDIGSAISMPMMAGGRLVGVLNVSSRRCRPFTLGQVKGLSILAGAAAAALESVSLYNQVCQAEEKYRSIFENAVEGIFQSTPDGRFLTANRALARILGYKTPEELIETVTNSGQQLYAEPRERVEFLRVLEEQGSVSGCESQFIRKGGKVIWVSRSARVVRNEDGSLFYEGTLEDITERKRSEEERQKQINFMKELAGLTGIKPVTRHYNYEVPIQLQAEFLLIDHRLDLWVFHFGKVGLYGFNVSYGTMWTILGVGYGVRAILDTTVGLHFLFLRSGICSSGGYLHHLS